MKKIVSVAILLLLAEATFCQLQFRSLDDVFVFAKKGNLSLQKAELNRQSVGFSTDLRKSELLPKINAFTTAGYDPIIPSQVVPDKIFGGAEGKFSKVQFGMPYNAVAGLELNVAVLNFEKWAALRTGQLEMEKAKWTLETTREELRNRITEIYYKTLAFQQLIGINHENLKVSKQLLDIMEKRKEKGVINPADLNRTKNLVIDIESTGLEFEKNYAFAVNEMRSLLNLSDEESISFTDSLVVNWDIPALKGLDTKAASRESAANYDVALQQLQESRKASLPKLSLQSRYYHQWLMTEGTNAQTVHFDAATIGLRLDVSIFNGNYHRTKRKKAILHLEEAALNKRQVYASLSKQQSDWLTAFQQAKRRWSLVQQKLVVTADNLRIAQLSMKEEIMEFEEFNSIFNEYTKAAVEKVQTQLDGILYKTLLTQ